MSFHQLLYEKEQEFETIIAAQTAAALKEAETQQLLDEENIKNQERVAQAKDASLKK